MVSLMAATYIAFPRQASAALAQTRMSTIEPGGGSRSLARASVAATLRTAWAALALGAASSRAACAMVGFGLPASAASKKAFCAVARASLRPG